MTWWLRVRSPVEATFLAGVFSLFISAEACGKVVGGFGKKSCVSTGVRKPGNTCVTDRHDMTLAVKVALNPNTTNQPLYSCVIIIVLSRFHHCTAALSSSCYRVFTIVQLRYYHRAIAFSPLYSCVIIMVLSRLHHCTAAFSSSYYRVFTSALLPSIPCKALSASCS